MPAEPIVTRRMQALLGTFVEIAVMHMTDVERVNSAIDGAFARIADIHQQMSLFDEKSVLSQLNHASGRWLALPRDTLRVLKLARALTRQSQHRFNCTVGGELLQQNILPRLRNDEFLLQGRADDIKIVGNRVRLLRPVYITLDGIAKGYAIDCALAVLKRQGFTDAAINAGGDLRVRGALSLPVWQRQLDGSLRALGQLHNAAMASSHARREHDAQFPAHIIRADLTAKDEVLSVIARFAWRADALTKVMLATALAQRQHDIAQWRAVLLDESSLCAV